jgi:hypothetical protein
MEECKPLHIIPLRHAVPEIQNGLRRPLRYGVNQQRDNNRKALNEGTINVLLIFEDTAATVQKRLTGGAPTMDRWNPPK